jgi:hypothetical protein
MCKSRNGHRPKCVGLGNAPRELHARECLGHSTNQEATQTGNNAIANVLTKVICYSPLDEPWFY